MTKHIPLNKIKPRTEQSETFSINVQFNEKMQQWIASVHSVQLPNVITHMTIYARTKVRARDRLMMYILAEYEPEHRDLVIHK